MPAHDHPEYSVEDAHLRATLAKLEKRIDEIGQMEPQGPTAHDTAALFKQLRAMYDNLLIAREQVYFGRLDFAADSARKAETHYIGRVGFDHGGQIVVVDWRAPLARLFSRRRPGQAEYHSPDGRVSGHLHLKRHLHVQRQALLSLHDEFDARPSTAAAPEARPGLIDPDAYLREILSGRREAQLRDIVATIQEHQDDLIRADPGQVLVIQGVAGSGKTSIALHRVAFLLYPGNKTGIEAQRCIIFGPNQLFLGYIANVLPGLGVKDISQMTLDAWALERLGLTGLELADATLDALLSSRVPEREKLALARRGQIKASLRMGRLLDRFAEWWRTRLTLSPQGLVYRNLGPLKVSITLSQARLLELYRLLAHLPLMIHRERFQEDALRELMGEYSAAALRQIQELAVEGERMLERGRQLHAESARLDEYTAFARQNADAELEDAQAPAALAQGADGLRALADYFLRQGERMRLRAARLKAEELEDARRQERHPEIRAAVQEALEADLENVWPALDPVAGYDELLADRKRLSQLSQSIFEAEEIALLHASTSPVGKALDVSDLPALCYLHTLIHGVAAPLYDHVVVDEAQDVAPLYFAVLKRLSRNGSFTILGDLAQGVYAYRGIASWEDVRRAFDGAPYSYHETTESYRSTYEIVAFANHILELLTPHGQKPLLAKPFDRRGAPVQIKPLSQPESLAPELIETINGLRDEGYQNIAVIVKTAAHCAALAQELQAHQFSPFQAATAAADRYTGGVFILPVHLAKGMEFEAALIVGADDQTYPSSEFDGRLLYVAATRALHALHIFAVGPLNVHLELAVSYER